MNFLSLREARDHPLNCWVMWSDLGPGSGSKICLTRDNGSASIFKALLTYSLVYLRQVIWSYAQLGRKVVSHVAGSWTHFDIRNLGECKCSGFQTRIIDWSSGWLIPMIEWSHEALQLLTGYFRLESWAMSREFEFYLIFLGNNMDIGIIIQSRS
jgi:hypothetical protein